ncbi:MAG: hypothetical protein AB7I01_14655 [Gammaproteobacteria bacterium]
MRVTPKKLSHVVYRTNRYEAIPDDNQMEFQMETFEAQRRAPAAHSDTPRRNNPIGVEYDPDAWLRRLRAGAHEDELLVRTEHEPISPIRGAFERG